MLYHMHVSKHNLHCTSPKPAHTFCAAAIFVPPPLTPLTPCPPPPPPFKKVEAGEEPGLEYDADSEEELDAVGALCTEPGAGLAPPLRFKLLHNLWSTGVPRTTNMTLARQDSGDSQGGGGGGMMQGGGGMGMMGGGGAGGVGVPQGGRLFMGGR